MLVVRDDPAVRSDSFSAPQALDRFRRSMDLHDILHKTAWDTAIIAFELDMIAYSNTRLLELSVFHSDTA